LYNKSAKEVDIMEKLLIKNGLIVTMNPNNEVIRNGSIYVEDNIIKEIGPDSKISNKTGAKEIDAHGKTIIPGMISCHNHLYSAVVRSIPYSGFESPDFSVSFHAPIHSEQKRQLSPSHAEYYAGLFLYRDS